jgi:hypothetical protein
MTDASVLYDRGVALDAAGPESLLERYEALLTEAVEGADDDSLTDAGVDDGAIESIRSGEAGTVTVEDAAAAIAAADGSDPDALLAEVRDALLMGMSSAMLDVDRVAADVEGNVDPKEVQGMVEGRHPMTVEEYARIHHYVASKGG